jgi:ABC-type branched-subunit amino acid transport system ATPase component
VRPDNRKINENLFVAIFTALQSKRSPSKRTTSSAEEAAILFVEHDMELVERYAARVIAFYEGRVIADGAPDAVLTDVDVRRYVVGAELHRRADRART